ncbi:hypothetical protein [Flavihumibacter sp. CACIAM 22H1]|uniref:hypothetical protein n=1 Tax=Flavihumibacter sp. CACIAM 22H1 TaxID=1812911 RepID=UPI0007A8285E|nr:hypothetical protein [Flavihumibacter sp. CACIAM 22H1]KYP16634.1 MAG: hypothetical protein A1D16_09485 [Flavihumibacter sp. CACIAM 22H1]
MNREQKIKLLKAIQEGKAPINAVVPQRQVIIISGYPPDSEEHKQCVKDYEESKDDSLTAIVEHKYQYGYIKRREL